VVAILFLSTQFAALVGVGVRLVDAVVGATLVVFGIRLASEPR
jgi:hypothetical protein